MKEKYYQWLKKQICLRSHFENHQFLLREMHRKEFYWVHPMDENRAKDGAYLRILWDENYAEILNQELGICTFLEMLIAFSRRVCGEAKISSNELIIYMLKVGGLYLYTDKHCGDVLDPTILIDKKMTNLMEKCDTFFENLEKKNKKAEIYVQFCDWCYKKSICDTFKCHM